ncbi:MAG TPA: SDR family oxidoreductase [Chitinophagaceae bacterium]|nr:SDR family oxidoreductase [Chitinophagaceae bacterium]
MILVTGATGNFVGSTAQYLQQKNIPFKAASRNLEALKKRFGSYTELVTFDWDKPETFANALKDIATVYIVPPAVVTNDFHIQAKPFIEAAKKAGVRHIVINTALYSDNPDSIFYETEALVKKSGIDFTIIRPGFVFQNFLNQFLQSVRDGVIFAPSEKGKTSYVDIRNVGEAAAVVLENPAAHKGKTYAITGREALTHSQMADIFSQQLSKQVVHISPSPEEYKKKLASLNLPSPLYEFLAVLYGTIAKGQWEEVSNDYTLLTGKKPNTFADFVKENRDVFSATN